MPTTDEFNIYYSDTSTPWSQAQESAIQASSIENALSDVRFGANLMFERYIDMTNYDVDKLTYGQKARVYNDSIDTANGEYVWKGASWMMRSMDSVVDLKDPDQRPSGWKNDTGGETGIPWAKWGIIDGTVQISFWFRRSEPITVYNTLWMELFPAGTFPTPQLGANTEYPIQSADPGSSVAATVPVDGRLMWRYRLSDMRGYPFTRGVSWWIQGTFSYIAAP